MKEEMVPVRFVRHCFLLSFVLFVLFCTGGCEDDRAASITGPQVSTSGGPVIFAVQVDKTKMGMNETLTLNITATCNGCLFGDASDAVALLLSYSSNGKIDPSTASETFSLAAGKYAESATAQFTGIVPASSGVAIITANFSGVGENLSVSTEVKIE